MKTLSTDQVNQVIAFLELGQTTRQISASTGFSNSTISCIRTEHCPNIPKATGGRPSIISPTDMWHAIWLLGAGKAENAVQITKTLQDVMGEDSRRVVQDWGWGVSEIDWEHA